MRLHRLGEPPPGNDNARVAAGIGGDTVELANFDSSLPLAVQQGLTRAQLEAIKDHRRTRPREPLAPAFQRELARSWRQFARRAA